MQKVKFCLLICFFLSFCLDPKTKQIIPDSDPGESSGFTTLPFRIGYVFWGVGTCGSWFSRQRERWPRHRPPTADSGPHCSSASAPYHHTGIICHMSFTFNICYWEARTRHVTAWKNLTDNLIVFIYYFLLHHHLMMMRRETQEARAFTPKV